MKFSACLLLMLFGFFTFLDKATCDDLDEAYPDDDGGLDEDDEVSDPDALPPKIISEGGKKTFSIGDTISLPCNIQNSADAVIQWRRGSKTNSKALYFDHMRQTNNTRINMDNEFTLSIKDVQIEDADEYYCQLLSTSGQFIVYNIEVISANPKILRLYPEGTTKTLKKGKPLTLMCEAIGVPKPKITWTHKKKHSHIEEALSEQSITIDKVSRKHSGEYTCTANNGKGVPDKQTISIVVEYEPEIETNNEIVNSAEGYESELTCLVHAHPGAKVTWFKNDLPLKESHHISQIKAANNHSLRISATKKSDFGSYKCVANNSLGTSSKVIQLSGLPSTPVFESTTIAEDEKSPHLTWKVVSHSPVQQFELMFKKQQDDKWEVAYPTVTSEGENVYFARHILKNLEPGTYVAQIRARNNYGWSSLSEAKPFSGDVMGESGAMQSKLLEESSDHSAGCNLQIRISLVFMMSLFVGYQFS